MRWKRIFYFLLLNVIVSAATVIGVLYAWERYRPLESPATEQVFVFPTNTSGNAPLQPEPVDNPTDSPVETSSDTETYVVQSGDTLSSIAFEYDVAMERIMTFNDLSNPDALDVGMVLIIPLTEDAVLIAPTEEIEVLETEIPDPPVLEISETELPSGEVVLEIVTVIAAGDLQDERVIIQQRGDAQVSLQGWKLINPVGQAYVFPQLVLFKGGEVTVYTKSGVNTISELYWSLENPAWESGALVLLRSPDNRDAIEFRIP